VKKKSLTLLAASGVLAGATIFGTVLAADISGAGASFPYPVYAKWADSYKKSANVNLNYQSIGSGGGIKQIIAKTVTFGATDAPMKAEDLEKNGLIQFPTVIGGVVPVVNLDGIKPGAIKIDGPTLAKIFLGEVKTWNDAAIAKLNPGVNLPSTAIAIVHRSDGSGTTFLFTNYLGKVSKDWDDKVGVSTAVKWPAGIGAKGNEGVANTVAQTKGAIGYVEFAYVKQNKMVHLNMINKDGKTVEPSIAAFQAAAAGADWSKAKGFNLIITDQAGEKTWPIAGATFILIHKQPADAAAAADALKFFDWAYKNGAKEAEALDYVPLPEATAALVRNEWTNIKGADGKPLYNRGS
jgi:phosphate transport system substrate-binding protein